VDPHYYAQPVIKGFSVQPIIAAFWGKARLNVTAAIQAHPLVAHSLDVAAVAVLMAHRLTPAIDPRMLGFLVSLHDVGKFSRPFQAKRPELWPAGTLGPYRPADIAAGPSHDAVGGFVLSHALADRFLEILPPGNRRAPGWKASDSVYLWRALAGHHGRPTPTEHVLSRNVFCQGCESAVGRFVAEMHTVFQPPPWIRPPERDLPRLSWRLAGLTTLADWVGSRQEWFPFVAMADVADPGLYFWGHALPRAAAALAAAGLAAAPAAPFTGVRGLFPLIPPPTPIQHWAENAALPDGPVLAVIEDLTGSGKTEAALTLAHRLLADGRADGVYLALPTMATANAMFERLQHAYRRLFAPDGHPSLALAHGRAGLNAAFIAAIKGDGSLAGHARDPADEPAEAHCTAWLAQDRRRALLAHVGVGTLDQALLAVLPVRQAPLRLHGLAGKVLIVDEVHAFDPYMRHELATLLRFHASLGGSAILLSATLPAELRRQLVDAFRDGLGAPAAVLAEQAYPLATIAGADGVVETPCQPRPGLPRRVNVTRLPDAETAVERIAAAASAGAAVAWVRNTVDDAIEAVALLRQAGIEPLLFHARFAMADRLRIEREVLQRFGPGERAGRPGVLVATQVVEQSLDIDFDLMVTDLAPADLLIQRAGRLWRHDRPLPRCVAGPELLVVSPDPVGDPPEYWIKAALPGTASVYRDHALLWRSAREVFRRGAIVTPEDMRPIIEAVFDRNSDGAVPPGLAASDQAAEGKKHADVGLSAQNVLDLRRGYSIDAGLWEPDIDTPTRLEDRPHVTLRLACLRDGKIVPYAGDTDLLLAWAQSEVSVAQYRIAACPVPPELEAAALDAKAQWGRWERDSPVVVLALLRPDGDGYTLDAQAESGAVVAARYDAWTGLSWPGAAPAAAG
jgi:CRISPR-associated endonuclease/helicase Cas3